MDQLYYQTLDLEKVRAQVLSYSRELYPATLLQPESHVSERDALVSVYQLLQALHVSMAKDLLELEILLALSSTKTISVGPTRSSQKFKGKIKLIQLSSKESEVLNVFSKGYSYCEAADLLDCKLTTIQTHAKRIYKKLKVHSRSEAVFEARQLGLFQA